MIYFLYEIVIVLLFPAIICYHGYRSVSRGRRTAFRERFGFVPDEALMSIDGHETIWVHAVSVGETIAVKPLLRALRRRFPDKKIVLSNVTETGRGIAETLTEVDLCLYFPFDYRFAARNVLRKVNPSLVVVVETEIWPNFLRAAAHMGIPTVMVNGRISDRSFDRYLKFRWFFRPVLANFTALCMQSAEDARRIVAIGADSSRVHVARNLKYDIPANVLQEEERSALKQAYRIPAGVAVITAGSTHAGEDEMVLDAYQASLAAGHLSILVLVPRHPERAGEVAALLRGRGIAHTLRSQLDNRTEAFAAGDVLLVDTIGELMRIYSFTDLAFVGGSLVPTGGHNILEPASLGAPVIFGPFMSNFRDIAAMVLSAGGGVQVQDGAELTNTLTLLLADDDRRISMGEHGARLMSESSGATERHLDTIASLVR